MFNRKWFGLCLIMMSTVALSAQESAPKNWFNLSPADGVPGANTEKAYQELLKGRKGKEVVVAVIDSGVDYEHEDLRNVMWVNAGEIPGNGIDDDNNGYVDDVYGWNFLGNKKGENIAHDNLEVTRLYKLYSEQFEGKDPEGLSKKEKALYAKYEEYKEVVEEKRDGLEETAATYGAIAEAMGQIQEQLGEGEVTVERLDALEVDGPLMGSALQITKALMGQGQTFESIVEDLNGYAEYLNGQYKYHYNPDFDPRPIINDDFSNPYDRDYGNSDVRGPDALHGTHVAGIIAAERGNDIGMDGVAADVRIMSVRAVPDGDERDKDVAAAIVYAVDNGASIINMSFGKGASPRKGLVDEAVRYAMKHDVLLVHAAGNDGKEVGGDNNFPTDRFEKRGFLNLFGPKHAPNWLEVGALNWKGDESLAAPFSNYSSSYVDVFAPGMAMYATVPFDKYKDLQGTSMAAPVVAGVAAMLRSHFPDLTAEQVKDILMQSANKQRTRVIKPGSEEEKVPFSSLSVTGGILDAYEAVKLAEQTKGKKKGVSRPVASGAAAGAGAKEVRP